MNNEERNKTEAEIIEAINEFADKIWYNRHHNMLYKIEAGEIIVVPENTPGCGQGYIHENILQGALKCAERMRVKYKDPGPWSDFEWGMINGKLSALRWVLGSPWDDLHT